MVSSTSGRELERGGGAVGLAPSRIIHDQPDIPFIIILRGRPNSGIIGIVQPPPLTSWSEDTVLRRGLDEVAQRLPTGWSADLDRSASSLRDAVLSVRDPQGAEARFVLDVRLSDRGIAEGVHRLRAGSSIGSQDVIVSRYISARRRSQLVDAGAGYIDMTGNIYLVSREPGLYVRDIGAGSDPWRGPGRPRQSFDGRPAAAVVRALADVARPMSMLELAEASRASTGATYRMVEFLQQEGLVGRAPRGRIVGVRWRRMLEEWSESVPVLTLNEYEQALEPRGLDALVRRLREPDIVGGFAVTGTLAVRDRIQVAPARLALLYARGGGDPVEELGLRRVDRGANVLIVRPKYDVVFDRARMSEDGLPCARDSQVAVDLLTSPGRGPEEGAALLDWMEQNESIWRD